MGGVSVHDGWTTYRTYTDCRHALWNIHHLRELTFLEEQYQQAWAKEMKTLLLEMKTATEQARADGLIQLPVTTCAAFVTRYQAVLASGHAANPPPERRPHQRGRVKQSPAQNLFERLWVRQEEALAFLDDLTIPFDNNQAERDLRTLKPNATCAPSRSGRGCVRSPEKLSGHAAQAGSAAARRVAIRLRRSASLSFLGLTCYHLRAECERWLCAVEDEPRRAGHEERSALRQHLAAWHHRDACLRSRDEADLRRRRDQRPQARAGRAGH